MQSQEDPTQTELKLVSQLRKNVRDLRLARHHLETKNLLRFVRARGHSLENAEQMLRRQIEWREEFDMDHILEWNVPSEYLDYWLCYHCGYDRLGNTVLVLPFGVWDAAKVGEVTYSVFQRTLYRLMETYWRVIQGLSQGKKVMTQFTLIVDVAGLSWKTVTTYDAMHGVVDAIRCFDVNFPETLRIGYVVNYPYVFNVAWNLIKPILSGHTHSKLMFLGGSDPTCWREEISKVIEPGQFPQQYGGDLPNSTRIEPEYEYQQSTSLCKQPTPEPTLRPCCSQECLCK